MNIKKSLAYIFAAAFLLLIFSGFEIRAQPSAAQVKKQLTNPKTVSITLGETGGVEWSRTYRQSRENRRQ